MRRSDCIRRGRRGAVLVRDGRIDDIGSAELPRLRYPDEEVVDSDAASAMSGTIDLNTHLGIAVLRGAEIRSKLKR